MSNDVRHDLNILIAIAKLDASLNACRGELARLPDRVESIKSKLEEIEESEKETKSNVEAMNKERRELEQQLEDNTAKINKYKEQLMQVKTNKEYTAMLSEIGHLEKDIDAKEERLLLLMDELDQQDSENKTFFERVAAQKRELKTEQSELEKKIETLEADMKRLESEKPAVLRGLDAPLKKRYDRILAKLNDFAVTSIAGDICQGCFTRVTPQRSVEVRKNDQIITCEGCGRILVYYTA